MIFFVEPDNFCLIWNSEIAHASFSFCDDCNSSIESNRTYRRIRWHWDYHQIRQAASFLSINYECCGNHNDLHILVQCGPNMFNTPCGPLCPEDCSRVSWAWWTYDRSRLLAQRLYSNVAVEFQRPLCLGIVCWQEERCACYPGYVLRERGNPSAGCVLPEECYFAV